jgi:hypothetical protein
LEKFAAVGTMLATGTYLARLIWRNNIEPNCCNTSTKCFDLDSPSYLMPKMSGGVRSRLMFFVMTASYKSDPIQSSAQFSDKSPTRNS